jgi:hypothetical protein
MLRQTAAPGHNAIQTRHDAHKRQHWVLKGVSPSTTHTHRQCGAHSPVPPSDELHAAVSPDDRWSKRHESKECLFAQGAQSRSWQQPQSGALFLVRRKCSHQHQPARQIVHTTYRSPTAAQRPDSIRHASAPTPSIMWWLAWSTPSTLSFYRSAKATTVR